MAKIKLVKADRFFIPSVEFPTDEGNINNRELPESEQVKCEITLATIDQKSKYIGSYSTTPTGKKKKKAEEIKSFVDFHYEDCVKKHCGKITGLEDYKVTSGITLVDKAVDYADLNDLIQDIFFKVCGIHEDDSKDGSDGGELTEGE